MLVRRKESSVCVIKRFAVVGGGDEIELYRVESGFELRILLIEVWELGSWYNRLIIIFYLYIRGEIEVLGNIARSKCL